MFWDEEPFAALPEAERAAAVLAVGVLVASNAAPADAAVKLTDAFRTRQGPLGELIAPLVEWREPPSSWLKAHPDLAAGALAAGLSQAFDAVTPSSPRGAVARVWLNTQTEIEPLRRLLSDGLRRSLTRVVLSAYKRDSTEMAPIPAWRWPLRLGVSPDVQPEVAAAADARNLPWGDVLMRPVRLGGHWSTATLAIVDGNDGLAALAAKRSRVAAIIVMGSPAAGALDPSLQQGPLLDAGAVAWVPIAVSPMRLLDALIEELAHDASLDEALCFAAHRLGFEPPLVCAPAGFLRRTRLRAAIRTLADALPSQPMLESMAADRGDRAAVVSTADGLLDSFVGRSFDHERHDAADAAASMDAARRGQRDREVRYLNGDVMVDGKKIEERLRPARRHELHLSVAPTGGGLVADTPFPDEDLPWTGEDLRLDVVFTELAHRGDTQRAQIVLPPSGASSTATFTFSAGAAGTRFRARIALLYQNRFVQTALLDGPVGAADGPPLALSVECVIRPQRELAELRGHQAALIFNHEEAGPLVTAFTDEVNQIRKPTGLGDEVRGLRQLIEKVVDDPDSYGSLNDAAYAELLIELARGGSNLYRILFAGTRTAVADPRLAARLAKATRVSVLSAVPDTVLPLELVYDRELASRPGVKLELCPDHRQGLEAVGAGAPEGVDAAGCCTRGPTFVCPLGFWGLRKVIERHVNPELSRLIRGEYAINPSPTLDRNRAPLGRLLAGASTRADLNPDKEWSKACEALRTLLGDRFSAATSLQEWADAVGQQKPRVLLLVPHVERSGGTTVFEIGESQRLSVRDDLAPYVGDRADGPMVVLLGCATGPGDAPPEELPGKFLDSGAKLVLATLTVVRGRHVAPLAAQLVKILHALITEAGDAGMFFGDAILALRRRELATNPMALTLVAYGDADWQVVKDG